MTDEVVTRLYRCLVEELDRRGVPEGRPVTVSELYQTLVPYRSVRSALGVELNADYEHALLRLLAGERDLLRLDPDDAREELRREVDAPYPFVGLFRKFSASNVWIDRSHAAPARPARPAVEEPPAPEPEAGPLPDAEAAEGTADGAAGAPGTGSSDSAPAGPDAPPEAEPSQPAQQPAHEPADDAGRRIAAESDTLALGTRRAGSLAPARLPVQLHREPERADAATEDAVRGLPCTFCGDAMPGGHRIRFCPYCGADQRMRPCSRCDAVLERDWRFCISCGHDAKGG